MRETEEEEGEGDNKGKGKGEEEDEEEAEEEDADGDAADGECVVDESESDGDPMMTIGSVSPIVESFPSDWNLFILRELLLLLGFPFPFPPFPWEYCDGNPEISFFFLLFLFDNTTIGVEKSAEMSILWGFNTVSGPILMTNACF